MAPATRPEAIAACPVTQQSSWSVHETLEVPAMLGGSGPACAQVWPDEVETKAAEPIAVAPTAMQWPSTRHETATRSSMAGGVGAWAQSSPPSLVAMMIAWPPNDWFDWPTATQCSTLVQAIPESEATVGGMTSFFQVAPPLVLAMIAAPLGAPSTPTVEPTAQQREALAQSRALRELTGAGGPTVAKFPSHGESWASVESGVDEFGATEQAATDRSTITVTTAPPIRRGLEFSAAPNAARSPSARGVW
jgi:hypothetical protein